MKQEFKLNNFDLLRIFAASQVLVCHTALHLHVFAPQWLMKLIYAFPGVPIFFVISGFLISLSYERSSGLKSYCRNRVLRIYPGLQLCERPGGGGCLHLPTLSVICLGSPSKGRFCGRNSRLFLPRWWPTST